MAFQDVLTALQPLGHTIIALDESITSEVDAATWRNYLDEVSGPIEQHDAIVIVPFADIDAATEFAAYAETQTSFRFVAVCFHGSMQVPAISASIAGAIAALPDVATPLNDVELPGLTKVADEFVLSRTRIEAALHAGVTVIANGADGIPKIVSCITTYQKTTDGNDDDLMLSVNAPLTVAYTRVVVRDAVMLFKKGRKNTARARKDLRTVILNKLIQLDNAEILQNVVPLEPELVVIQDPDNRRYADVTIPMDMVPGMDIVAGTFNVYST